MSQPERQSEQNDRCKEDELPLHQSEGEMAGLWLWGEGHLDGRLGRLWERVLWKQLMGFIPTPFPS